ncbi:MAG TPA: glycerol kinase GlpK [Gammaproteobacteria bacterium]|nr:glycerol kinase GlpK [Gammaproteobacteria bacterium]
MSFILAIDQGTTGTTVLVFDRDGEVRARNYSEFTQHYPQPGWVEHDAEEIIAVTVTTAAAALEQAGAAPNDIHAIGISNQRETTVLWDRASGAPVAPAIVWQDRRTADACERLKREGCETLVREKTGLVLDPYFSATKLAWLLDQHDGLRSRAERGELAFGTIDSWLMWRLTGGAAHVCDETNAARTLLYDIRARRWDAELLRLFNIPAAVLPAVKPSAHVFGEADPAVLCGIRAPIAGVAGDQQAALFGHGCHRAGLAKNTYGTGSFLLMHTGEEAIVSRERLLTTSACNLGDEAPQYALEGAIFTTGAAVQWLRDGLGIIANAAETEALAASAPNNGGVYFVPALAGLGAPHWDAHARGLLVGITRGTGRAEIARAVLESIAYRTRDLTLAMERESGVALSALRCDGGGSANNFLMQFQADMLGVPVEVPALADVTALGAACLAGIATGFWSVNTAPFADRLPMQRYEPNMPDTARQALYERWLNALARARDWAV